MLVVGLLKSNGGADGRTPLLRNDPLINAGAEPAGTRTRQAPAIICGTLLYKLEFSLREFEQAPQVLLGQQRRN